jgi:hypothetical protein
MYYVVLFRVIYVKQNMSDNVQGNVFLMDYGTMAKIVETGFLVFYSVLSQWGELDVMMLLIVAIWVVIRVLGRDSPMFKNYS